jgi:hypothetical protein
VGGGYVRAWLMRAYGCHDHDYKIKIMMTITTSLWGQVPVPLDSVLA